LKKEKGRKDYPQQSAGDCLFYSRFRHGSAGKISKLSPALTADDSRFNLIECRWRLPSMMTLLFLLATIAMLTLILGNTKASFVCFGMSLILSLYWFSYHASDQLAIVL
jgi:hypothetical protein